MPLSIVVSLRDLTAAGIKCESTGGLLLDSLARRSRLDREYPCIVYYYFLKYMLPTSETASITIIAVRPVSAKS